MRRPMPGSTSTSSISSLSWDELLARLAATPRENGSAELHRAAAWLFDTLERTGLEVERVAFTAHPYALRLAGVVALAAAFLYLRAAGRGRGVLALAVAVAAPVALVADLDYGVPVFSWIGAEPSHHVVARLDPAEDPVQRLVLAAHYDTKTDLLDHGHRSALEAAAPALLALLVAAALALALAPQRAGVRRGAQAAGWLGVAWGVAFFGAVSAGAFVPERGRSPGALDNGGSCAVLVELAERLATAPPPRRTQVEILLLAAEEVGVQGSRAYVAKRFAGGPPDLSTWVINLEGLGASMRLDVSSREDFVLERYPTDPALRELLAGVYRERNGADLGLAGASRTDARAFLAAGIPAVTLFSVEPGPRSGRGLHSAGDDRSRLDPEALEASVAFLAAVVDATDAHPAGLR